MIFRRTLAGMAALSVVAISVSASANDVVGSVSAVDGHSFVSHDGRLLQATPTMRLYQGDRVITQAGSSAKLALAGGCSVALGEGSMATVSSCSDRKLSDTARVGYQSSNPVSQGGSSAFRGASTGTLLVGLLALAAAAAGILAATDHHHGHASSPNSP